MVPNEVQYGVCPIVDVTETATIDTNNQIVVFIFDGVI